MSCFAWPRGVTAWPLHFKGILMRDALQKLLIRALLALSQRMVALATWLTRKREMTPLQNIVTSLILCAIGALFAIMIVGALAS
jgi:hypothetical protein